MKLRNKRIGKYYQDKRERPVKITLRMVCNSQLVIRQGKKLAYNEYGRVFIKKTGQGKC